MEKFSKKKRKLIRFLFGTFSFTAVMFAFQACYGVPETQFYLDGKVISAKTGEPIEGIKVYNHYHGAQFGVITDENGEFHGLGIDNNAISATLCLRDIDGAENGTFINTDTLVNFDDSASNPVILTMEEKSDE